MGDGQPTVREQKEKWPPRYWFVRSRGRGVSDRTTRLQNREEESGSLSSIDGRRVEKNWRSYRDEEKERLGEEHRRSRQHQRRIEKGGRVLNVCATRGRESGVAQTAREASRREEAVRKGDGLRGMQRSSLSGERRQDRHCRKRTERRTGGDLSEQGKKAKTAAPPEEVGGGLADCGSRRTSEADYTEDKAWSEFGLPSSTKKRERGKQRPVAVIIDTMLAGGEERLRRRLAAQTR